jgi:hypothetical protein
LKSLRHQPTSENDGSSLLCQKSKSKVANNNDEDGNEHADPASVYRLGSDIIRERLGFAALVSARQHNASKVVRENRTVDKSSKRCVIDVTSDDEAEDQPPDDQNIGRLGSIKSESSIFGQYLQNDMDDEEYEIRLGLLEFEKKQAEIEKRKLELRLERKAGKKARIA